MEIEFKKLTVDPDAIEAALTFHYGLKAEIGAEIIPTPESLPIAIACLGWIDQQKQKETVWNA